MDERELKSSVTGLADKMFHICVEFIQTVSSHFKYVSQRFITILQFKFTCRSLNIISDMNFTFCFHIISACPEVKYLIHGGILNSECFVENNKTQLYYYEYKPVSIQIYNYHQLTCQFYLKVPRGLKN